MTHAERVREAERVMVETAVWPQGGLYESLSALVAARDALLALRAAACPTCGGTGAEYVDLGMLIGICPAGCEAGRRRDA